MHRPLIKSILFRSKFEKDFSNFSSIFICIICCQNKYFVWTCLIYTNHFLYDFKMMRRLKPENRTKWKTNSLNLLAWQTKNWRKIIQVLKVQKRREHHWLIIKQRALAIILARFLTSTIIATISKRRKATISNLRDIKRLQKLLLLTTSPSSKLAEDPSPGSASSCQNLALHPPKFT